VAATWDLADRRASSITLYPEVRAAIAAARRAGRLTRAQLATAKRHVEGLWRAIDRIDLTTELAIRAGDLAETHALRGFDAVHVASAEAIAEPDMVLVARDGRVVAAARALGLAVAVLP
jgi:predicted nucleic acid-binding protein